MPITSLEQLSLLSLKEQIYKGKITIKQLEPYINSGLFDKLNEMLINDSINHFQETTFKFLKGELIVKTALKWNTTNPQDLETVFNMASILLKVNQAMQLWNHTKKIFIGGIITCKDDPTYIGIKRHDRTVNGYNLYAFNEINDPYYCNSIVMNHGANQGSNQYAKNGDSDDVSIQSIQSEVFV